jgi:hypothetical protein
MGGKSVTLLMTAYFYLGTVGRLKNRWDQNGRPGFSRSHPWVVNPVKVSEFGWWIGDANANPRVGSDFHCASGEAGLALYYTCQDQRLVIAPYQRSEPEACHWWSFGEVDLESLSLHGQYTPIW